MITARAASARAPELIGRCSGSRRVRTITRIKPNMNVVFVTSLASFAAPYPAILLFRDNVQHYLQNGRPEPGYPQIHAIADRMVFAHESPLASQLWDEFSLALAGIDEIEVAALAMSIRTQALITGVHAIPAIRGTVLVRQSGWQVPMSIEGKATLGELFGDLRDGLAGITASGTVEGYVDVVTPRL